MKKIKILYVITSTGFGGAERLLLSHLQLLDHSKYKFFVCSLRDKPDDLSYEISKYADVIKLKVRNKFNPIIIKQLAKLFREIKPDIIHTHLFQARLYSTLAHILYKKAILLTHKHNNVNLNKHNFFLLLESLCLIFNKRVIAISESVKKSLRKYEFVNDKKIVVIHNGIDCERFYKIAISKNISTEKPIIIGTVCRLERQKGIRYLLLAMSSILAKFPTVQLEIIGDGSIFQELKMLSANLGISNSVKFFGKFADVIPFYKRMDVFVLPSLYEGFGIVLLEAMAAGIPVVATNVDGITEVIENEKSGILIPPKDPEAITDAVRKIILDPQLAKNLVQEGLKRSAVFDIKEHVMKIDKFYDNLLGVESCQ